jgi:cardiolipin synthase
MRHLPNIICLLRIALVWPLIVSLQAGDFARTVWIFAIAAVSDGLDGFLAKRFGWTSTLGKVLDPVADKLLLVSLFLMATWLGLIPQWLTFMAVTRDVMIGTGALVFSLVFGALHGRPILISKINTLMQLSYLMGIVLNQATGFPPAWLLTGLLWCTAVTVALSGMAYLREFTIRAARGDPPETNARTV